MATGARLGSDVSLRPSLFRQLVLFTCIAIFFQACSRKTDFADWGLPADLTAHLGHVEILKVPAAITRLDWIPMNLKGLDASGASELTAIPYLPMGLERLNVSRAKNLAFLPTLPSSIRELDINSTAIKEPWTFPQGLESLTLGGPRVRSLDGLSNSLLELKLENVSNLQSSAGLPASLQSLSISGAKFEDLIGLPPRLKVLSLTNLEIRVLKELPLTLESLRLAENEKMEVELPPFLRSLTLAGKTRGLSGFEQLVFLSDLTLLSPTFQSPVALSPMPAFLRSLAVSGPPAKHLPPVPRGLIELRWEEGYNLGSLPRNLKNLSIQDSPLSNLAGLPSAVEGLDIGGPEAKLAEFPKLPSTLRRLRYRYCPFNPISDLPRSLQDLDLKGSRNVRDLNVALPMLERLNISETSIARLPELGNLQELDISNTPLRFPKGLQSLPRNLRRLTVHAGQLDTLDGLPDSVKELYFVDAL